MAWGLDFVGTQQQCNTALTQMTSSTGTAQEVAQLARCVSDMVNEVNSYVYSGQSPTFHIVCNGSWNLHATQCSWRIENVALIGAGPNYDGPLNPSAAP